MVSLRLFNGLLKEKDPSLRSFVSSVRIIDELVLRIAIASCNSDTRISVDRFIEREVFEVWQGLRYQEICTMGQVHWRH